MTPDTVITVFQQALQVIVVLVMTILLPALGVGLLVAMFQAATQINEQTLTFIPKIMVTLGMMMIAGPWMLAIVLNFAETLIESIPMLIG